jgi:hypothetical protein
MVRGSQTLALFTLGLGVAAVVSAVAGARSLRTSDVTLLNQRAAKPVR